MGQVYNTVQVGLPFLAPVCGRLPTVNDAPTLVDRFARCIEDVDAWLRACSRLRFNPTKTQVLWLGSRHLVDRITVRHVPVLSSSVQVVDSARDLGVVIDSHLTMADHVTAYFHLRQLHLVTRSLSVDAAMTLVQSFISCHLAVTLCSVASQTVCSGASSRCRTRQRDSSPAFVDVIMTIVCKFGGDPAICLVEEAICAIKRAHLQGKSEDNKFRSRTDGQTDRQTDDGRRAIVLAHRNELKWLRSV